MSSEHNTVPRRLRFGTVGWRHPDWAGSYYPEDLPEEWQLGYYANELSAVLLPASVWRAASTQQLADWAGDVHAGFLFYLFADPGVPVEQQQAHARVLGERLGGLLWPAAPAPQGAATPLDDLPGRVQAWGDGDALCLALLDVAGLDLRARRKLLDELAPHLARAEGAAVILAGVAPGDAHELQTVAELMGLA